LIWGRSVAYPHANRVVPAWALIALNPIYRPTPLRVLGISPCRWWATLTELEMAPDPATPAVRRRLQRLRLEPRQHRRRLYVVASIWSACTYMVGCGSFSAILGYSWKAPLSHTGVQSKCKSLIARSRHHRHNYKQTTSGRLTRMSADEWRLSINVLSHYNAFELYESLQPYHRKKTQIDI